MSIKSVQELLNDALTRESNTIKTEVHWGSIEPPQWLHNNVNGQNWPAASGAGVLDSMANAYFTVTDIDYGSASVLVQVKLPTSNTKTIVAELMISNGTGGAIASTGKTVEIDCTAKGNWYSGLIAGPLPIAMHYGLRLTVKSGGTLAASEAPAVKCFLYARR